MDRKKIVIEQVDNGFIVKVVNQGASALKELYTKPIKVFTSYQELNKYLELSFSTKEGIK